MNPAQQELKSIKEFLDNMKPLSKLIVNEVRKEVFNEIEKNAPYRLMNDDWYVKIKSKLLGEKE